MARIEIPSATFTRAGTSMPTPLAGDVANGHTLPNDGHVGLIVKNTDSSAAHSVTITISRTVDGQTVAPRVTSVPANTSKAFGPFDAADYGSALLLSVDSALLTLVAVRGI